eukprot:CAMPEP_0201151202 /NCGR_PEP_ID=MMETSP0851-20130426/12174_1 /ASSEMBLY_ACC=CAM_ASM_000631 /TAXON_ID=183588 /ORGANISM="Pseudo-nitzschia fraudulenta, Strain WWA7" /LENGTH=244 /DNA_ID=CAMNT_0047428007 /DNA_START=93 /DNA_END=827 /DNA_ORIENTATION=+
MTMTTRNSTGDNDNDDDDDDDATDVFDNDHDHSIHIVSVNKSRVLLLPNMRADWISVSIRTQPDVLRNGELLWGHSISRGEHKQYLYWKKDSRFEKFWKLFLRVYTTTGNIFAGIDSKLKKTILNKKKDAGASFGNWDKKRNNNKTNSNKLPSSSNSNYSNNINSNNKLRNNSNNKLLNVPSFLNLHRNKPLREKGDTDSNISNEDGLARHGEYLSHTGQRHSNPLRGSGNHEAPTKKIPPNSE